MNDLVLTKEVRVQINRETGSATGLPNYAYTSEEFFELERATLFRGTWVCVGNACTVSEPGSLKPVSFLGSPLLVVRDKSYQIRVFHNVCSHRGNELVWDTRTCDEIIRCPYHGWAYGLDGQLRATPHIGGIGQHEIDTFDKSNHGLREARSEIWMDLVFVNLSGTARPFHEFIAPLQKRIDVLASPEQFTKLEPAATHGSLTIRFNGNWKLDIENNLESYHLPWVHPELNSISRMEDHYCYFGGDLFAGQASKVYEHRQLNQPDFPIFEDWPGKVAEYPTLFPNVFLGFHCDHYWTRVVEPVAKDQTLDHFQLYYLGDAAATDYYEGARSSRFDSWSKVFNEDIGVIEGMQRGRQSAAFKGGVFSPVMDEPSHYFAKWIANRTELKQN